MDNNIEKQQIEDDEIDLIAIAKTIWEGRKVIIKSTIICTIIGLFIAIFSPKEYTATTTFIPQVNDGKSMGGSLGGLAAMAGINMGSMASNTDISPSLYPQIIASTDFCKDVMTMEMTIRGINHPITFYDYFIEGKSTSVIDIIKRYTIGLPRLIINKIKTISKEDHNSINLTERITSLSKDEYELKKIITKIITANYNEDEGIVLLSAVMPEPYPAAQIAQKALQTLQKHVTQYKTQKAQVELHFVQDRYMEQKVIFEDAQLALAMYTDKNKNITSAKAKSEYEKLNTNYQLKFNVYSELAKQLEQAKLKVTENTPSFSIIQDVEVPNEKSAPKRGFIITISIIIGGFIGLAFLFIKKTLIELSH